MAENTAKENLSEVTNQAANQAAWANLAAKQNLSAVTAEAAVEVAVAAVVKSDLVVAVQQEEGRVTNNGKQQIAYI